MKLEKNQVKEKKQENLKKNKFNKNYFYSFIYYIFQIK